MLSVIILLAINELIRTPAYYRAVRQAQIEVFAESYFIPALLK